MPSDVQTIIINDYIHCGAELDDSRRYRYALWRLWDNTKPYVVFIGLNPSTADETSNDKTLQKCIHFAASWGFGGVYMANLFAYRATDPDEMKKSRNPVGKDNDYWLKQLTERCNLTVAAWGNHGIFLNRSTEVKQCYKNLVCLKINKSGEPAHPLYQPNNSHYINYN